MHEMRSIVIPNLFRDLIIVKHEMLKRVQHDTVFSFKL
jgi:hypothetical protein